MDGAVWFGEDGLLVLVEPHLPSFGVERCHRQRSMPLFMEVGPPFSQWMQWWVSHQPGGRWQWGNRQCRSRRRMAPAMGSGQIPVVCPMSRISLWAPSTMRVKLASHSPACFRSTPGGFLRVSNALAASTSVSPSFTRRSELRSHDERRRRIPAAAHVDYDSLARLGPAGSGAKESEAVR